MKNITRKTFGRRASTPILAANDGATIIDLPDRHDIRPAVDEVVRKVKRAQAENPDKRVIVLMGEDHATPLHMLFQQAVYNVLKAESADEPVLAYETPNNLLEMILGQDGQTPAHKETLAAIAYFRKHDPKYYQRLQLIAYAATGWGLAPITNHLLASARVEAQDPTRMVDLPLHEHTAPDNADHILTDLDHTHESVQNLLLAHYPRHIGRIPAESAMGIHLRNIAMLEGCTDKLTILQTGNAHIAGNREEGDPYTLSLHAMAAQLDDCVTVPVFPETVSCRASRLWDKPTEKKLMKDPYTTIIRGGKEKTYMAFNGRARPEAELKSIRTLCAASGIEQPMPQIKTMRDFEKSMNKTMIRLRAELKEIVRQHDLAKTIQNPKLF